MKKKLELIDKTYYSELEKMFGENGNGLLNLNLLPRPSYGFMIGLYTSSWYIDHFLETYGTIKNLEVLVNTQTTLEKQARTTLANVQADLDEARKELQQKDDSATRCIAKANADAMEKIAAVEADAKKAKEKIAAAEAEMKKAKKETAEAEAEMKKAKDETAEAPQTPRAMGTPGTSNAALNFKINGLQSDVVNLKNALATVTDEKDEEIEKLKKKVRDQASNYAAAIQKERTLGEKAIEELQQKYDELEQRYQHKQATHDANTRSLGGPE